MKKKADVIGGGVLCALSIATGIGALFLKIGTLTEPQPGFFPFAGSLILLLFSGIIIFKGFLGEEKVRDTIADRGRPAALVAVLVVFHFFVMDLYVFYAKLERLVHKKFSI